MRKRKYSSVRHKPVVPSALSTLSAEHAQRWVHCLMAMARTKAMKVAGKAKASPASMARAAAADVLEPTSLTRSRGGAGQFYTDERLSQMMEQVVKKAVAAATALARDSAPVPTAAAAAASTLSLGAEQSGKGRAFLSRYSVRLCCFPF